MINKKNIIGFFSINKIAFIAILLICFSLPGTSFSQNVEDNANNSSIRKLTSLSFSWSDPVSMAAFKRGEYLWIVFDHMQTLDTQALNRALSPLGKDLIQIPHTKATIVRLTPDQDINIFVRKEGFLWVVDFSNMEFPNKTESMSIFIQNNSINEPYIFIPTTTAGNIVSFVDPEIGDNVVIAPTSEVRKNIAYSYSYPDIDFLETLQGIVVLPKSNDLIFNRGNNGVNIRAINRGLYISPNLDILRRREFLSQTDDDISSLTKEIPTELLNKDFRSAIAKMNKDINDAPEEEKNERRMDLARYYVGKGLSTNAINLLKIIEASRDEITEKEKFHGLYSVALFLTRRYEEALVHLSYGRLPNINEAIFWRTLNEAALDPKPEYNVIIQSFLYVMKDYPEIIKERIAMVAVEPAFAALDDISIQNFIDVLKNTSNAEYNQAMIDYLSAEKLSIQSYPRSALKEYRKAAESQDQKYSSLARFEAALLEYKLNARTADKTIPELERLKFAWGDRKFKIELLENLSLIYEKNKDYYNAINSLKLAISLGDDMQKTQFTGRMISLFEDVFINNQADNLPPLKSISLYHDFEWLAPLSSKYNEILQNIADRLVAVDLNDRAASILNNQLRYNTLTDLQRAKIGARLSLIYLFDEAYTDALRILDQTEADKLPDIVKSHRKIIRARALASLGRKQEALNLLKNDTSRNATILKSEIHWNAGNWGGASDEIKYLVDKPEKGKPLNKEQINLILDWITALKKAGRETVIVRIRNVFTPYFKDSQYFSTFNVLTNKLEANEINIDEITQVVNDAKAYSDFSKLYIDSLKQEEKELNNVQ